MVRKNLDGSDKAHGQQFEEIEEAQRRMGHGKIGSIHGSKTKDKAELAELADEALEQDRQRKMQGGLPE